jgi:hypothetical protein
MLETSIPGNRNKREPRNRLEFATLLSIRRVGDHVKATLALGIILRLAVQAIQQTTRTDMSATTLTQAQQAEIQS